MVGGLVIMEVMMRDMVEEVTDTHKEGMVVMVMPLVCCLEIILLYFETYSVFRGIWWWWS